MAFVREIIEMTIDDAPWQRVFFPQALQLGEQALAQVLGADADRVKALQQTFRLDQFIDRDALLEADVLDAGIQEAAVIEIADEILDVLGDAGVFDLGSVKLGEQMLLERGGGHDAVHHELPALLIIAATGQILLPALLPVFAPLLVHLGDGADVIGITAAVVRIVRNGILEGGLGRFELDDRVLFDLLLDDLAQLQRGCLQNLQALLHLRPEGEFLGLDLLEALAGHGVGGGGMAPKHQPHFPLKQTSGQRLLFLCAKK